MRLFVAVNLPAEEQAAVWSAAAPLRDAGLPVRWVAESALHITLKFLGEVDEVVAGALGPALSDAVGAARPFDLGLGGFGAFPSMAHPRVLWFGIERHPALELLANDVESAVGRFGFAPELKPFNPHLTLGRAEKDARQADFRVLGTPAAEVEYSGVMRVEAVDLMRSTLGRGAPAYTALHRAPLAVER
ncbi:MAG: RNA 2',3'-cyclic phosphodiesterase [Gemmatimonadales bacterium]|nr:RNA 2',3'-cyclic phosphodiesterase [Gemmatimonadales bacterium]